MKEVQDPWLHHCTTNAAVTRTRGFRPAEKCQLVKWNPVYSEDRVCSYRLRNVALDYCTYLKKKKKKRNHLPL